MLTRPHRFNFYLLAGLLAALAVAGCATGPKKGRQKEASIRFHLELNAAEKGQATNVVVGRSAPFQVTVDRQSFLTEFNVEAARVQDTLGGFAIAIQFDVNGTILLEQYTTAYRGRRAGIIAEFGELRWLAAPVMQSRVANGQFLFTPDATREEAERIVEGLNRVAKRTRKQRM